MKKDINLLKKIEIEELSGYYLTELGKLCYKNKEDKWLYCKSVKDKPNWVFVYIKGEMVEYNERKLAIKYIDGYAERVDYLKNKKEKKQLESRDLRYKVGVDRGAMSYSKIPLPMKPYVAPKPLDDTPKQKLRLLEAQKRRNKNSRKKGK